jgi:uncharacterized RDD family membrane protein YckC
VGYQAQSPFGVAPRVGYGGFWIRFVAWVIDYLVTAIPIFFLFTFASALTGVNLFQPDRFGSYDLSPGAAVVIFLVEVIAVVWGIGYFVYFWSGGGTLGMKLFRLRVGDASTGRPIGVWRAMLRYVGFILATLPCYVGLIWAAFDGYKQGWHDKIANTIVWQG